MPPMRQAVVRAPGKNRPGQQPTPDNDSKSSNIRVVVRIRPQNAHERDAQNSRVVVQPLDEKILVFDPREESSPGYFHGRRMRRRNVAKRKNRDKQFAFDHIFAEGCSQEYVYQHTTKSIVDSVLSGYNCSVFAYGATGAGKTFTMLGGPNQPGINFLTVMELYQKISSAQSEKLCDVAVSYLEIYNETVKDLLVPSGPLAIREDPQRGVVVSGLSLHKPKNATELFSMLEYGNTNRTQHPTDANAQSSRSHAVFQVFVRQRDRTASINTDVRVAKMSLIDLAGSERATVTTNRGARFREGANINRSLLALGNCINALADSRSKGKHVPYRNSKLTRLLKDSLGGNCRTVMIAAVSPSSLSYEDTFNTLRYADRAKEIKSQLQRNVVNLDVHITRYTQVIEELQAEVAELKSRLQAQTTVATATALPAGSVPDSEQIMSLRLEVHHVFQERSSIRKELMELESFDRDLTAKIIRKNLLVERLRLIHGKSTLGDKTRSKLDRVIATSVARKDRVQSRKVGVERRMRENQEALERVKAEMTAAGTEGTMPEPLRDALRMRHLEIEVKDGRRQAKHLRKLARNQEMHIKTSEKLILSLITAVRSQYYLLKGSGLATSDLTEQFESLQKQVEGEREVMWADQSVGEGGQEEGEGGEEEFTRLINLPVLSCVQLTPKTPSHRRVTGTSSPHLQQTAQDNQRHNPMPTRRLSYACAVQTTVGITPTATGRALRIPESETHQAIGLPQRVPTPSGKPNQAPERILTPQRAAKSPSGSAQRIPSSHTIDERLTPQRIPTPHRLQSQSNPPQSEVEQSCSPDAVHAPPVDSTLSRGKVAFSSPVVVKEDPMETCQVEGIVPLQATPNVNLPGTQMEQSESATRTESPPAPNAALPVGEIMANTQSDGGNVDATSRPGDKGDSTSCHGVDQSEDVIARTISFDEEGGSRQDPLMKTTPTTALKMTYAQVASSPALSQPSRPPFGEISVNSPLTSRAPSQAKKAPSLNESFTICKGVLKENFRMDVQQSRNMSRRETFAGRQSLHHQRSKSHGHLPGTGGPAANRGQHTDTLRKFGLPSMTDTSTEGTHKPLPAYMSMTKAAANKRRGTTGGSQRIHSQPSKENQQPTNRGRALFSTGPLQPANGRGGLARSFSVSNIRNVSRNTHSARNQSSWNL